MWVGGVRGEDYSTSTGADDYIYPGVGSVVAEAETFASTQVSNVL